MRESWSNALIEEAERVIDYLQRAGLRRRDLVEATLAAGQVENPQWRDSAILSLRSALDEAYRRIPFGARNDLKRGWDPRKQADQKRLNRLLILSLLLVLAAGYLTEIYNQAKSLLSEIQVLQLSKPDEQFSRLSRDLIAARSEMLKAHNDDKIVQDARVQKYYAAFDSLSALDSALFSISERKKVVSDNLSYPWPFQRQLVRLSCDLGLISNSCRDVVSEVQSDPQQQSTLHSGSSSLYSWIRQIKVLLLGTGDEDLRLVCPQLPLLDAIASSQEHFFRSRLDAEAGAEMPRIVRQTIYANAVLTCFNALKYLPYGSRDIANFSADINARMSGYASWILPGIYGAFGTLLFHLRVLLDPLRKETESLLAFQKIAIGALAGMVLAWFWVPDIRIGDELRNVGFGLFLTAFVFGFSLDIFFALLDRMVNVTRLAVVGTEDGREEEGHLKNGQASHRKRETEGADKGIAAEKMTSDVPAARTPQPDNATPSATAVDQKAPPQRQSSGATPRGKGGRASA